MITAVLILVSRGGMGGGDLKLFFLGFVLGWQSLLLIFFLSSFFGTLVSVVFMGVGGRSLREPIPFGPYIVISACGVFFFGKGLINWYVQAFFSVG